MINFRFHLVSLIAVFLALGLGVVMGATVIDEAIVDGLNDRINSVEDQAREQREDNTELREEIERLEAFVGDEFAVAETLADVPVPVVAPRGVSGDDARSTVAMLQTAGANAPGVLWLEDKFHLDNAETRQELADLLDEARGPARELRAAAWAQIAERLQVGTAPEPPAPDVLALLEEAGFVTFQAVGEDAEELELAAYPGAGARVLLIDQSDASDGAYELVESAMRSFVDAAIPEVVGEVYREEEDGPNRGLRLAAVRDDDVLVERVSTVDNLDQTEGKVAAVYALADLGRGVIGQYGYGDTASMPLPPRSLQ